MALPIFNAAKTVLAYIPIGSEVNIKSIVDRMMPIGKTLVLPKVNRAQGWLELYEVRDLEVELVPGPFGTSEPRGDQRRQVDLDDIDLALVPGVAFTATGTRLGYGGGFYDRLLQKRPRALWVVGPAFSIQILKAIPVCEHDVSIDSVITEQCEYQSVIGRGGQKFRAQSQSRRDE